MSTLDQLAADLAYAAGRGAEQLGAQLTHSGATQAELGVALPGSGLIRGGAQRSAENVASNPDALAARMAVTAAEKGVKLVLRGQR
jgi:hypothetical protein